jgi:UDP-N-acetylglucosamine 1-carboxyvinyltransferase
MPGGDEIGTRPIDLHLAGLERMGATITLEHGFVQAEAPHGLRGTVLTLDYPSVGATENLMMAAVAARGTTVIDNAAREPEIADVASFLTALGARIAGAGTSTIEVEGVDTFAATTFRAMPDRIEAGTWATAAVATHGDVTIRDARPEHLDLLLSKLADAGADVSVTFDGLRVRQPALPRAVDFVTLPYPGLATDFQPIMLAMLSVADGTAIATENVFESRFLYVDELRRMGADIRTEGHHAVIRGVPRLSAAPVRALDIRAGAAMVIAALCADGVTEIADVYHLDRGYEDLEAKLRGLGVEVTREGGALLVPDPAETW